MLGRIEERYGIGQQRVDCRDLRRGDSNRCSHFRRRAQINARLSLTRVLRHFTNVDQMAAALALVMEQTAYAQSPCRRGTWPAIEQGR